MKDWGGVIIVVCFLGFLLFACWLMIDKTNYTGGKNIGKIGNVEIVEIEGCEYLKQQTYMGYEVLTHKGNCKNKIHYGSGK